MFDASLDLTPAVPPSEAGQGTLENLFPHIILDVVLCLLFPVSKVG